MATVMERAESNYMQDWGHEIAQQLKRVWNRELPCDQYSRIFSTKFVCHFHDKDIVGIGAYSKFIDEVIVNTDSLDLIIDSVITNDNMILLYYRWKSLRWHNDVTSESHLSNYCKSVIQVDQGKIVTIWEQIPNFLYLIGKRSFDSYVKFPKVIKDNVLRLNGNQINVTNDHKTLLMVDLFKRMNDCFIGREPMKNMDHILRSDMVFYNGSFQGNGIQAWKTFAYALRTCLGSMQGVRFDDIYIRHGDELTVYLRAITKTKSPYILQCLQGSVASLKFQLNKNKISKLVTNLENYIPFLDTDFTKHDDRLKRLFRGERVPVIEPPGKSKDTAIKQHKINVHEEIQNTNRNDVEQVAIIGMAGKFPKCETVEELWDALVTQKKLFSKIPENRSYIQSGTKIKYAGFIDNIDLFDTNYFKILPSESEYLDPQQRLLLEELIHCIEDSGYSKETYSGNRTGIFISSLSSDYMKHIQDIGAVNSPLAWTGNEMAMFPSKIARLLDIQGPCKYINAECSSSLVAIHEASAMIRSGLIDQAIIGATNLLLHSYGFSVREDTLLTDAESPKIFSNNSQGQLRGEAVVVLVLKSLSQAIKDCDRIYGTVAGSAVNNNGKTLSLVAGNVEQQTRVINDALKDAGINHTDISLVESHASGVRGGDYSEIAAIKKVYGSRTVDNKLIKKCNLSTVKGAIGHAEAASGLTAMVKLLLQLQHNKIVGTQGVDILDPDLQIDLNTFSLTKDVVPWIQDECDGIPQPRFAGINGFAAGGYNAHIVVKEYIPQDDAQKKQYQYKSNSTLKYSSDNKLQAQGNRLVIVLSAHNQNSLNAKLIQLLDYLKTTVSVQLIDLAYTLQCRQDAMKHRIAFVVNNISDLIEVISTVIAGGDISKSLQASIYGKCKTTSSGYVKVSKKEIDRLIKGNRVDDLAKLWVDGYEIPWIDIRRSSIPSVIYGLPKYPFDRKSFWASHCDLVKSPNTYNRRIHPLIGSNISNLYQQCYFTKLSSNEDILSGHVILGRKVLPGVAYLEMILGSLKDALNGDTSKSDISGEDQIVQFRNIVWVHPITIDDGDLQTKDIKTVLLPADLEMNRRKQSNSSNHEIETIRFEIFSGDGDETNIHFQGNASICTNLLPSTVDLNVLHDECNKFTLSSDQIYTTYNKIGLAYGPVFRGVESIKVGFDKNDKKQALAKIVLPDEWSDSIGYALHPAIMDSAIHSAIALEMDNNGKSSYKNPPLPFAVDKVEVYRHTNSTMWAFIRRSENESYGKYDDHRLQKFDIDVIDESGTVCVHFVGFTSMLRGPKQKREPNDVTFLKRDNTESGSNTRHSDILSYLRTKVANILQVSPDQVDINDELSEFGFDSIHLTKLANELNERYQIPIEYQLNPTVFFDHPTLKSFTEFLVKQYPDIFKSFSDDSLQDVGIRNGNIDESVVTSTQTSSIHNPRGRNIQLQHLEGPLLRLQHDDATTSDIAIVGMSCSFPMADDVDQFWDNLTMGKDCITEIPRDRWRWEDLYGDPTKETNKTNIKWGGFVSNLGDFDPLFFGISPREAELMDPQQRLIMNHVWLAIEDAGYSAKSLSGSNTAIYMGTANSGYDELLKKSSIPIEGITATGTIPSVGPNRMSYFLNIHGPSEPVETACSSSLVAIHRAITSINNGNCEMAIAGGVNIIVTPDAHIGFSKAGMLCEDGRCKTFSSKANGYVRGEGVGVLLLKKLTDAEQSGDHIYGIIKGSSVNHGGRSNSLTAPNPVAQAELIKFAYNQAGIDPTSVGYIEAHGTGTELGDPIEINGLKAAFADLTNKAGKDYANEQTCGLGSVKSNIGHLELAAGVAGVIKVLMQIKYRTLVKTLHCDETNPYIQLDNSPFFIVKEKQEWRKQVNQDGAELPLRAGVSSFGFGGVNAHVIIEEYDEQRKTKSGSVNNQIDVSGLSDNKIERHVILLSAKSDKQLTMLASRLKDVVDRKIENIENSKLQVNYLRNIAYTLQLGRDEMNHRLAMVVTSLDDLSNNLSRIIKGTRQLDNVYHGFVKSVDNTYALFHDDDDLRNTLESWLAKGKSERLAQFWVKGVAINWTNLNRNNHSTIDLLRRISLPTYPFNNKRYWIPEAVNSNKSPCSKHHPLLHQNISTLSQQKYHSVFTGNEIFFKDHEIMGYRILPAAAYIELVRASIHNAICDIQDETNVIMNNIVWIQPIKISLEDVGKYNLNIYITLVPKKSGEIEFVISSIKNDTAQGNDKTDLTRHCQGIVTIGNRKTNLIDIETKRSSNLNVCYTPDRIYSAFQKMGIKYGPSHQGIEQLECFKNSNNETEIIAQLIKPDMAAGTVGEYVVNPSTMDSALQACIGYILYDDSFTNEASQILLPFRVREVVINRSFTSIMWVWIRPSSSLHTNEIYNQKNENSIRYLDIDLYDDSGNSCLSMKGYSSRYLSQKNVSKLLLDEGEYDQNQVFRKSQPNIQDSVILTYFWEEQKLDYSDALDDARQSDKTLLTGGCEKSRNEISRIYPDAIQISDVTDDCLNALGTIDHLVWISPIDQLKSLISESVIDDQEYGIIQLFRIIKLLLNLNYSNKRLNVTIITTQTQSVNVYENVNPTHSGISGFVGTLDKEQPLWNVCLFDLPGDWAESIYEHDYLKDLPLLQNSHKSDTWVCRNYKWYRQMARADESLQQKVNGEVKDSMIKENGVYILIGGAGGIGEVWSEYLIRVYNAQIFWIGRRSHNIEIQNKIDRLSSFGPSPRYIVADASDREQLESAYLEIKNECQTINGIIHSAVVLNDKSILNMDEQSFRASYSTKVDTCVRMIQAFEQESLDFVLFFSSLVSCGKPPGQSNYTSGCCFVDSVAKRMSIEWPCLVKVMNWGFWGSVGIGATDDIKRRMARLGVGSISADVAMESLELLLSSMNNQIALVNILKPLDEISKTVYSFLSIPDEIGTDQKLIDQKQISNNTKSDTDYVITTIVNTLSTELKVNHETIDIDEPFSGYGLDSITGVQLSNVLRDKFEIDLDTTVFFDYNSVRALSEYLLTNYPDELIRNIDISQTSRINNAESSNENEDTLLLDKELLSSKQQLTDSTHKLDQAYMNHVVGLIKQLISGELKVDSSAIDIDEEFSCYGLDSITGVSIAQKLNDIYSIELDITVLFDFSTVRELSAYILKDYEESVIELFKNDNNSIDISNCSNKKSDIIPGLRDFLYSSETISPENSFTVKHSVTNKSTGYAVIGLSGSFPKSNGLDSFWNNLIEGNNCIEEVPASRWNWKSISSYVSNENTTECFKWGGFIDDVACFDADFFGIDEVEAMYMSPQQRLLMTHVWKAIEDAGITRSELAQRKTGVFIGTVPSEYLNTDTISKDIPYVVTGISTSMIPNRISQTLNISGPSEYYDTACSSSSVAIHRAIQSIQRGECEQAIVGAINLLLSPTGYVGFESMNYLSDSGSAASFQPQANGFVRAEGVGVVLIKPVESAVEDEDRIYAVIRGTGVSHGGNAITMTTPNGKGMKQAIQQAYQSSGIDPRTVSYIEAHGIASPLGDAIEINSIKNAYQKICSSASETVYPDLPCYIGSMRPCIGYPEVASGIASLIKVILALRNKTLPGIPKFSGLHENISLKGTRFHMTSDNQHWNAVQDISGKTLPRRAAINNYGFSGVNAHLILEEYESDIESEISPRLLTISTEDNLFVFSAKKRKHLWIMINETISLLKLQPDINLQDFAYTLQVGREAMDYRIALLSNNKADLINDLKYIAEHQGNIPQTDKDTKIFLGQCEDLNLTSKSNIIDDKQLISEWLQHKQLGKLAKHWVSGGNVYWKQLHQNMNRRRINIPGYPLDQKRYWYDMTMNAI